MDSKWFGDWTIFRRAHRFIQQSFESVRLAHELQRQRLPADARYNHCTEAEEPPNDTFAHMNDFGIL